MGADVVVDCTDSLRDALCSLTTPAARRRVPLVEGGVRRRSTACVLSIRPGESACYRCAFPDAAAEALAASAAGRGARGRRRGHRVDPGARGAQARSPGSGSRCWTAILQLDGLTMEQTLVSTSRREAAPRARRAAVTISLAMLGLGTLARVARELREDLTAAQERDPAARGIGRLEILLTYGGVQALLSHRVAHALHESACRWCRTARQRDARCHRRRDPSRRRRSATRFHRPRRRRRDRRDRRDRRQRDALPGRDARRHRLRARQAPPDGRTTTSSSARARSCSARSTWATARRSAPTRS